MGKWIVVLIHLHVVVVGNVPAEFVDEEALTEPQEVVKSHPVTVLAEKFKSDIAHDSLLGSGASS
jgi:hypothetical protein